MKSNDSGMKPIKLNGIYSAISFSLSMIPTQFAKIFSLEKLVNFTEYHIYQHCITMIL
jgi:hypothetical protein